MTKEELLKEIKERMAKDGYVITRDLAEKVVNNFSAIYFENLEKGESMSLYTVGTLKVVIRAPRRGRNPKTGEALDIPARKTVKLIPSQALRDALKRA